MAVSAEASTGAPTRGSTTAAPTDIAQANYVEIRVHGVSGTPPSDILKVPGEATAAVEPADADQKLAEFSYRADDFTSRMVERHPVRVREAFNWSKYTSGRPVQALWLLIAPMGFVNAAQFMLPGPQPKDDDQPDGPHKFWHLVWHAIAGACLRVIALVQTLVTVFGALLVGVCFAAGQIGGAGAAHRHAAFLWWAGFPLLVVLGMFAMTRNGQRAEYPERAQTMSRTEKATASAFADSPPSGLAKLGFLSGDPDSPTLCRFHLSITVTAIFAVVLAPAALGAHRSAFVHTAFVAELVVLLGMTVLIVLLGDPEGSAAQASNAWIVGWHRFAKALSWIALLAAVAGIGVAVAVYLSPQAREAPWDQSAIGDVFGAASKTLMWAGAGALGVMLLATALLAFCTRAPGHRGGWGAKNCDQAYRRYALGLTAWLAAVLGLSLTVGLGSAFVTLIALILNGFRAAGGFWAHVRDVLRGIIGWRPDGRLAVPAEVSAAALAWGIALLIGLLLAGLVLIFWRKDKAKLVKAAEAARQLDAPAETGAERTRRAAIAAPAMFIARLKIYLTALLWAYAGSSVVLIVVALLADRSTSSDHQAMWLTLLTDAGSAIFFLLALALGWLAVRSYDARQLRRSINVIWDVASFWPRSVHPLVPASYGQYTIGPLTRQIKTHLEPVPESESESATPKGFDRAVLTGHSQGSLITLTALLWLPPEVRRRMGTVTFGSQLRVIFPRAFPAYVNAKVVEWVWGAMSAVGPDLAPGSPPPAESRWYNLYRDTDPLAGPVLSWNHRSVTDPEARQSTHFPAPGSLLVGDSSQPGARICGHDWRFLDPPPGSDVTRKHSDFFLDLNWDQAMWAALGHPPFS